MNPEDAIKSISIIRYFWRLFGGQFEVNFATLEVTFLGSRKKIMKAAKILEKNELWYKIDWAHTEEEMRPVKIIIAFEIISLKKRLI